MLSSRDDSYKAHGLSVHGGVMRGVWCLERFGEHSQQAGGSAQENWETEIHPENGGNVPCG